MLAGYEDPEPQGYDRSSSFDYPESNVDESARGNVYSDDPGVTPCTAVDCCVAVPSAAPDRSQ